MTKVEVGASSTGVERVTVCSRWGIGFPIIDQPKAGNFAVGIGRNRQAGIWRVTGADTATYERLPAPSGTAFYRLSTVFRRSGRSSFWIVTGEVA
jgi:hypothetical protein